MLKLIWLSYILLAISIFSYPSFARSFYSRDPYIQSIIDSCSAPNSTTGKLPSCRADLHCILNAAPVDFSARWSAGASILAFIPTIVGLMSNSIEEVTFIAEDNVWLALLLAFSSTTAFATRFSERGAGEEGREWYHPGYMNAVAENIGKLLRQEASAKENARMRQYHALLTTIAIISLILGCGAVWYLLSWIITYGVVVFSCPSSVHVAIWAGLSQVTTAGGVLLRRFSFDTVVVERFTPMSRNLTSNRSGCRTRKLTLWLASRNNKHLASQKIILRCPRNTIVRWAIQTVTAVMSFALYTFGTVVLASMTMFPASDAIRVMVVCSISAGIGRLIGFWAMTSARSGKRIMIVNVPQQHMQVMREKIGVGRAKPGMNSGRQQDRRYSA